MHAKTSISKKATYSLMLLSLVAAVVPLSTPDRSGPSGVALVTVPVPTDQCRDGQPHSPCSSQHHYRSIALFKDNQEKASNSPLSQGSAALIKDELAY